jgi:uncharacterized protein (DUF342 family)
VYNLSAIRAVMQKKLDADRNIKSVEATGDTIEDAVLEAATLLGVSVRRLEYEVLDRGAEGFLGVGKARCKISAYARAKSFFEKTEDDEFAEDFEIEEVIPDVDGAVYVQFHHEAVWLKVTPPSGNGRSVTLTEALDTLNARNAGSFDTDEVKAAVQNADGDYTQVGSFAHNAAADSTVRIDVSSDKMEATAFVSPRSMGGNEITYDAYIQALNAAGIIFGINEDAIRAQCDSPRFKEKVVIAEGQKAQDGSDSHVEFYFQTDTSQIKLKESSAGKIDFKDLNIIQNVVEGQKLARNVPATKGVMGRTLSGDVLPAKDGVELPPMFGNNVRLDADGCTIVASINGQVVLVGGKINVETVYRVDGNVCLKTGNITFLGNILITGNVEEGFSVKATGNIEVYGTVSNAELNAEGDIIVRQGLTGRGNKLVQAGHSIWAKFIENSLVKAGDMVVVADGIINSQIDAKNRILCQGNRAKIIGGHLRAGGVIVSKEVGSQSGNAETICEVGYDPENKAKLDALTAKRREFNTVLDALKKDVNTLVAIKKQRKELPPEKEKYLKDMQKKGNALVTDIKQISSEIDSTKRYLSSLSVIGRVSVSGNAYPGTRIIIKEVEEKLMTQCTAVSFVLQEGMIRTTLLNESDTKEQNGNPAN